MGRLLTPIMGSVFHAQEVWAVVDVLDARMLKRIVAVAELRSVVALAALCVFRHGKVVIVDVFSR